MNTGIDGIRIFAFNIAAPGQFSCPFDFGPCGWTQDKTDVFDWIKRSGATPTVGTGPTGDHTTPAGSKLNYCSFYENI